MLFYEPMLSKDGSQTCATCHRQPDGFSGSFQFSLGVEGLPGKRQAMPVFNMAWHTNEFFWNGRAHLLRDQSILPIQDPLEMNETLENVVAKLSETKMHQDQFIRAFGEGAITSEKMSLALEQFMNNGLDTDANQVGIDRENGINDPADRAKFKVPSLRNIAVTAPYLHDGRFTTLEEVIDL